MLRITHIVKRTIESRAKPFMWVKHQRVSGLDSLPHPAALRQDHGGTGKRRIDMQPGPVSMGYLSNRLDRIKRGRAGRAGRGDHSTGYETTLKVGADRFIQLIRFHCIIFICGEDMQVSTPKPSQQGSFFYGAVTMTRNIHNERLRFTLKASTS